MRIFNGGFAGLALAISTVLSSQTALATDRWSGFSVSIGGGGASVDAEALATYTRERLAGGAAGTVASDSISFGDDETTPFGTVQVAYDQMFAGGFVAGVLADFDFGLDLGRSIQDADIATRIRGGGVISTQPLGDAAFEVGNVWNVGGRLGFLANQNILVYVLGGYSQLQLDGAAGFGASQTDLPDRLHGFFIGGGAEYMILQNLALRAEYRYADYEDEREVSSTLSANGRNRLTTAVKVDAEIQSIRGALVFKLNGQ